MRALAVIAVVTFHFAPGALPGGFLGVDIFFVLSGYLITRMIATEVLRFGTFRFGNFYRRRARRLLPGLAVVLTAALAAAAFWRDQLTTVRAATLAAAGYVSNWWLSFAHHSYFVTAGRPSMLQHLWSLAIEEQFYLFWPVLAVGVCALAPDRWRIRALTGVALLLALASGAEMTLLAIARDAPYGADASRLYYGTDTHSMGLLLGAAFGALAAGAAVSGPASRRLLWLTDGIGAAALVAVLIVLATTAESSSPLYRGGFLAFAAITATAAAAAARDGSRLGQLLDRGPMRWIAARSYSMYLWHWPVAVVTRPGVDVHWPAPIVLLVRVAVTVVLADVTYRVVERPVRTLGLRDSVRAGVRRLARVIVGQAPVGARLATAALVATALVAGGVLATGPKPTLSAGQKALASTHGGRDLRLGRTRPTPLPRPIGSISNVAAESTPPATPSSRPTPRPTKARPVTQRRALPTISAYGDSVMLGARASLDQRFPGGMLDAVEGRQPGPILQDVEQDQAAGKLNKLVLIGVGDNGLINATDLRNALVCLHRVRHVVIVNNRVGRPWEAPNNHTIARVVRHFRNVILLDWYAASAGHPSWFYDDGIHLTPAGARNYTRLIARAARHA
jgi:peptidoglycan/LPS O-acetylase OafA/YrhL